MIIDGNSTISPRGILELPSTRGALSEQPLTPTVDLSEPLGRASEVGVREPEARSRQCDGMASEENSERGVIPLHATPEPVSAPAETARDLAAPQPSEQHLAERNRRLQIIRSVCALMEQTRCTASAACSEVGVDQATFSRWKSTLDEKGEDGLIPQFSRCGNKSSWERYVNPQQEQWIIGRLQYLNMRNGYGSTAVRVVASEPECPPALSAYLRGLARFPKSVLRKAHINDQLRSKAKGDKNYQLNSIVNLRTMTEIVNGAEVLINPGDWCELYDMSLNQPFWFEVPNGDHPDWRGLTVDGIALGRQGLYAVDISSGKWLGHHLIGRPRDAYRAEDILRFLRLLMETWGKPRRGLILERGIWQSSRIVGYKMGATYGAWDPDPFSRPSMENEEKDVLVSGLAQLGIEISWTYSSNQKPFVEGGFNLLQRYMSCTEFADIGRYRGENEAAAKALVAAKNGRKHPAAKGFAHMDEADAAVTWAESFCNNSTKRGRLQHGIPDERWVASMSRWPLAQLTKDDQAVFLPERRPLMIRGGHVLPEWQGKPYQFINPELFAELGNGYRLLVAFDPSHPEYGAAIWNRENGIANHRNLKFGQFLGWAEYEREAPRFGQTESNSIENRKRYMNYHRTAFTAIQDFGGAKRREVAARDGLGNAVTVERTQPKQDAKPAPERQQKREEPKRETTPLTPPRTRDTFSELFGEL